MASSPEGISTISSLYSNVASAECQQAADFALIVDYQMRCEAIFYPKAPVEI